MIGRLMLLLLLLLFWCSLGLREQQSSLWQTKSRGGEGRRRSNQNNGATNATGYRGCWGCADSFGSRADRRKYIENSDCELRGENHPNPRVNSKGNFWRKPGLNPSCRLPETGKTLAGKIRVCGNYTDSAVALRYEVRLRSAYARSA